APPHRTEGLFLARRAEPQGGVLRRRARRARARARELRVDPRPLRAAARGRVRGPRRLHPSGALRTLSARAPRARGGGVLSLRTPGDAEGLPRSPRLARCPARERRLRRLRMSAAPR